MLPERFAKFQRETSGQKHERCADCCGVCGVKSRWRYRPTTSGLLPISGPLRSQIPERGRFRAVDCNNVPAASQASAKIATRRANTLIGGAVKLTATFAI